MSHKFIDRNKHGGNREKYGARTVTAALAFNIGQDEFTAAICGALRRAFGEERSAVKRVAQVANSNIRAAENWWSGKNPPNGLHLTRLVAMVPEVQAEFRRLAAMESDLDPEIERHILELHQTASRILASKARD